MIINSIIDYTKSGFKNVSNHTKQQRLSICNSCEFFNPALSQCKQCGCFLQIKTLWATEKCPLDKWGPEINTDTQPPSGDCGCNKK
jgi:hypothetical protein